MKRYLIGILLSVCVLLIQSCQKFLDTKPIDSLSPDNYYENEAQLNAALTGVYDVLSKSETYGDKLLGWTGQDADEAYFARNTITTGVQVYDVSTTDIDIANCWRIWYEGINRANLLLANLHKPVMDETARAAIEGEALFLRAYYHFMLVSNWGPVPLMLKPITGPNESNIKRTPAKEVYEQIVKDMTTAEALVKPIGQIGFSGRISKSAVRGILARVCLYMAGNPINDVSKYEEARKWAKMVIDGADGTKHMLNPSYSNVFINMCKDKYDLNESIWEVEFGGNGSDTFTEIGRVGSNNGILYVTSPGDERYGYSYGYINVTGRFFKSYETATKDSITASGSAIKKEYSPDLRRDWAISPFKLVGNPAVKTPFTATEVYERTSGKWRREFEVVSPKTKNGGPINFPLLRYSDVLLMFAEAENAIDGPTQDAIDALNMVRRRAYGKFENGEIINEIKLTNQGTVYTSVPTVTVTGGGGSGAVVVAKIASGKVSQLLLTNFGKKYTSNPTVTISGGTTGVRALATATITTINSADLKAEQISGKGVFLQAIQEERSRELCFESLRKRDLVRWNIFVPKMKRIETDFTSGDALATPAIPAASTRTQYGVLSFKNVTQRDELWPLSPREMDLNQSLRPQNNGW